MKRFIVISVAGVLAFALQADATIINVPDDQPTIQAGIDASAVGDTVRVAPGTYVENIDLSQKNIVIGSWFLDDGDPSYIPTTIIDGGQAGSVVALANDLDETAVITGFTIQNGLALAGGGILCFDSSPTITNNTISGNSADYPAGYGGGICCGESSPIISDNTITGNSADFGGGGIYCSDASSIIRNNTISGNSAGESGGGIFCYSLEPTITGNTICGNSSSVGGGGISCHNSSPTISNNAINGNSASFYGGGIRCDNSSPTISNNTISGNSADLGGGIRCTESNPMITNTIFWADTAPSGQEISLYNSSPVITYCDVQGGWAGEGNIDCDPMFCDPENGNYYLHANSCCVGAGQGGVDIGAFGIGCGEEIPTLSEWGMIILALLLLAAGSVAVVRRWKAITEETV